MYFKVYWTDADGVGRFSDPISKWTDAELFRREIGRDAQVIRY
jgi:hypothetical protein